MNKGPIKEVNKGPIKEVNKSPVEEVNKSPLEEVNKGPPRLEKWTVRVNKGPLEEVPVHLPKENNIMLASRWRYYNYGLFNHYFMLQIITGDRNLSIK